MRVLVVEDDAEVRDFLLRVIREAAWASDGVSDGRAALVALANGTYDLVVLDVGLPGMDGFSVCRALRATGDRTPVLVLTARNAVNDRVQGLDAGADDYLAKPFAVSELLARLRALARRPAAAFEPVLRLADLELDSASHQATRASVPVVLTQREVALLEYLLRNPRRVVSRAQILDHVWDDNFDPVANAVDVLVGRLRRKIDRAGLTPLLHTCVAAATCSRTGREATMRVSRLRLRLAAGFALAFAVGIGLLATGALAFLTRESTRRFDAHLDGVGHGLLAALTREHDEVPDSSLRFVVGEVVAEWPDNGDTFLVLDDSGAVMASRDPDGISARVLAGVAAASTTRFDIDRDGSDLRARLFDSTIVIAAASPSTRRAVRIVVVGSTEGIEADTELLGIAIVLGAPVILSASLLVGYLLAGRALAPVRQLTLDIANVAPTDLSRRLAPQHGDGELGALAAEFDALLGRLADAQKRNRQFVREAAHQIRTPLTLVLGEAELALDTVPTVGTTEAETGAARLRATVSRIRTAAEQMRRRVDELFLLAEASAGEVVRLEQRVELDGLVLECTDLMRARAAVTGHSLAIGEAEPVIVLGNAALLQEALLELIENACRHGVPCAPITVSCRAVQGRQEAVLEVLGDGAAFSDIIAHGQPDNAQEQTHDRGMGLSIVRWVAISHHGRFEVAHEVPFDGVGAHVGHNTVRLILPTIHGV